MPKYGCFLIFLQIYLATVLGYTNSDLQIAAIALHRSLTVVTRNVRDFAPTGVTVLNPFEEADD